MQTIFLKVLNMSITASWLILAVILLRLLLKKAPKSIRFLLWALVAVRLICPFSVESGFSLIPSAETVPENIVYDRTPEITTGIDVINQALNPVITQVFTPEPKNPVIPLKNIAEVAAILWAAGIFAMGIYLLVSYSRLKRRVSASVPYEGNIYICDYIEMPFILGVIRPGIYLPSDLSEAELKPVIAHEQAHLKRHDHWWKPLGFVLLAIYWFNPIIWIAYILMSRDIELACDEKVIRDMDAEGKKAYSEALLSRSNSRQYVAACPLAFGEIGVKERVHSVLNYKKPMFWIIFASVILCAAVAVSFLTNPQSTVSRYNAVVEPNDNSVMDSQSIEDLFAEFDGMFADAAAMVKDIPLGKTLEAKQEIYSRFTNSDIYEDLMSYGELAVRFCIFSFREDTKSEHVELLMALLCEDIIKEWYFLNEGWPGETEDPFIGVFFSGQTWYESLIQYLDSRREKYDIGELDTAEQYLIKIMENPKQIKTVDFQVKSDHLAPISRGEVNSMLSQLDYEWELIDYYDSGEGSQSIELRSVDEITCSISVSGVDGGTVDYFGCAFNYPDNLSADQEEAFLKYGWEQAEELFKMILGRSELSAGIWEEFLEYAKKPIDRDRNILMFVRQKENVYSEILMNREDRHSPWRLGSVRFQTKENRENMERVHSKIIKMLDVYEEIPSVAQLDDVMSNPEITTGSVTGTLTNFKYHTDLPDDTSSYPLGGEYGYATATLSDSQGSREVYVYPGIQESQEEQTWIIEKISAENGYNLMVFMKDVE